MITGFAAPRGHGKTLLMTARLKRRYLQGYKIYTNYKVSFPHEPLDAERLLKMGEDLQNCAIGIDEIHLLLDSRRSMKRRNQLLSYFITQTRKRNVVLFYTTQSMGQVDIRLRQNTDYWVFCKRLKPSFWFKYEIFDALTWRPVRSFRIHGKQFFGLYDTRQTITDFGMD